MDNDFSTWRAYQNRYWPMKYLIDMDGYVVYAHAGEGAYDETELKIQELLAELQARLDIENHVAGGIIDPINKIIVGEQTLVLPKSFILNKLYLGGKWNIFPEYASAGALGEIVFKYKSKNVYMTAGSKSGAEVEVYLDGKLNKTINIKSETLYTLIEGTNYNEHTLRLKIKSGTLKYN